MCDLRHFMRVLRSHRLRRLTAITAVLALLLMRAWVPAGFMPAQGEVFRLQLCQAERPIPASTPIPRAQLDHGSRSDHVSHGRGHNDPCPFGSAPPAGPLTQVLAFEPPHFLPSLGAIWPARDSFVSRLLRVQGARGPPAFV